MKSHYLLDLLRQHSRVIIPNFGAFLLKVKPETESDSDLQINFNDFLKFNDGLLIDYVSQTEQIDKYEAEHEVKEYVSKIQYSLINEGSFEVEGLGTIYKDEKGGLKFVKSGNEILQVSQPVKPDADKPKSKTGLSPLIVGHEERIDGPVQEKKEKPAFEIPKKETVEPLMEKPMVKPVPKPVAKTVAKTVPPEKPPKPPRKRKKLLPIWRHILIIVSVLLIVTIILYMAGFFDPPENIPPVSKNELPQTSIVEGNENSGISEGNTDDNKEQAQEPGSETQADPQQEQLVTSNTPETDESKADVQQAAQSSEKQDEPIETGKVETAKNIPVPKPVEAKNSLPTSVDSSSELKPFHIIAGSFNDKGNAYNYVLQLRAQGFDSRIVNMVNGFYRVSFNSYSTKSEALRALPDIREKSNPSAWFLYHKVSD